MKKTIKMFIIISLLLISLSPTIVTSAADKSDEKTEVIIGGEAFGIKMFSEGVIVTKTESFKVSGDEYCPAKEAGISANDIIISANEIPISTNKDLKRIIENSKGSEIKLKILRQSKTIITNITAVKNEKGIYKTGMWIKDSAAGLGTVSFYSSDSKKFCALGHGICESDTGELMPLSYGEIESADITSVTKSSNGKVGSLNGYFTGEVLGEVNKNNDLGIYGTTNIISDKHIIELGKPEDVTKGKATILTTSTDNQINEYEIEIKKIKKSDPKINMIIEITDENLLESTGGIVQGMSGSPIIQKGKLVGVVTHVLVDDVTKGYAIFSETMYNEMMSAA